MTAKIDLHLHTTASDGVLSPEDLVALCAKLGLEAIAITDHDTTDGIPAALKAAEGTSLTVIPGIEVSADIPKAEVHVLGYFIDYGDRALQRTLLKLRQSRVDRARRMVAKLAVMGMPVRWERVLEIAGEGAIGRPHVAQALYESGYVSSPAEAFALYIGRNGPAYVERYKLTPARTVKLITNAKGLAALAHPIIPPTPSAAQEGKLDLESLVPELVRAGLTGIEAYYPGYTPDDERQMLGLAGRFGLIATGGTDFHGPPITSIEPGSVRVPRKVLDEMREALRGLRG
ncbi:MAG: PHP domain-containing protein [Chloroflexi bacterium]|nr:PHP domain-containing protein [Chloroflexota bacterium]